jgi:hypothetical protein
MAYEKIKPYLNVNEEYLTKVDLAKAAVLLRFLTSIREYLEFGVNGLASAKETFDSPFSKTLVATIIELVRSSHLKLYNLISKI